MFKHVTKEQLKVPAKIDYLSELREFVTRVGKRHGVADRIINAFKLSIDEAATNIIKHAYRDIDGDITIRAIVKKKSLTIVLIDQGKYFDPRQVSDPDLKRYVDIGKKGGLGIFIMRRLLDEIDYRKTEEGNELWLIKNLEVGKKYQLSLPSIPLTFKARYWFLAIMVFSVFIMIAYFFAFFRERNIVISDYINRAQSACSYLAEGISTNMMQLDSDMLEKLRLEKTLTPDLEVTISADRPIKALVSSEHGDLLYNAFVVDNFGRVLASSDLEYLSLLDEFAFPENTSELQKNVYKYPSQQGIEVLDVVYPVPDTQGRTLCKAHFQMPFQVIQNNINSARIDYLKLAVIIWIIGAAGIFLLVYIVMNPFRRLADWVRNLGQPGVVEEMDIDTSTEVGEIAQAFSDITLKLRESQENLAEQERLQKEMQVAQEIQQTLLPSEFPQIEGYELSSFYEAAKEVGGDYFDFVEVDKDTLGIVVGDVSGKGVPGSLVMTMIRTALRTEARGVRDAAEVLAKVNDFVVNDMKKGMFVTLFYVIIDSRRRRLNYASAGHNPMILYRASTNKTYYLNPRGFPIGISLPDKDLFRSSIESDTLALTEDDILIIYTDGITEAMNQKRQLFGEERFLTVVRENGKLNATDFVQNLQEELLSFTEGNPQNDDITLVAIKEKTTAEKLEIERAKKVYELIQEGTAIKDACETVGLSTYAYYNKYKSAIENQKMEELEHTEDELIESRHLSIEEKTKIYDIIRKYPEYGAKRISEKLKSNYYGNLEISTSKIYDELVRARLNTKELREAFISRGGKKKRRLKPPGTPLLTIDGRVIIQKKGFEQKDEPELSKESTKTKEKSKPEEKKEKVKPEKKEKIIEKPERVTHDLLQIDALKLLSTPIEDLLDKRKTFKIQPQDYVKKESLEDLDITEDPFTEEEARQDIPESSENEASEIDDIDLIYSDNDDIDRDELDFVELIEMGEGIGEPTDENESQSFEGQIPEDVEIISEVPEENESEIENDTEIIGDSYREFIDLDQNDFSEETKEKDHEIDFSDELNNELAEKWYDNEIEWEIDEEKEQAPAQEKITEIPKRLNFDDLVEILNEEKSKPEDSSSIPDPDLFLEDVFLNTNSGSNTSKSVMSERKSTKNSTQEDRLSKALEFYRQEEFERTITEAQKVVDDYPDDYRAQILLGNAYFKSNQYQKAAGIYEKLLKHEPKNVQLYENLGVVYASQGDFIKALKNWEKLLAIKPERKDIQKSVLRIKKVLKNIY